MIATATWIAENQRDFAVSVGVTTLLIHTRWADWTSTHYSGSYKFIDLLDHASLLTCSDPRDHIYAFLGHPLMRASGIIPDYSKKKLEVYYDISVRALNDAGVRALSVVEHSKDTINENFPSWVIRWDVGFILNSILSQQPYGASALPTLEMNINDNILQGRGIHIDTISTVIQISLDHDRKCILFTREDRTGILTLDHFIQYLLHHETPFAYQSSRELALLTTLSADSRNTTKALADYVTWQRSGGSHTIIEEAVRNFWLDMASISHGRSFFITKKGFYGLGPCITQPGDTCTLFYGSMVPFVLRSQLSTSAAFKLVGESFLKGFMNGGRIEMAEQGGHLNVISIC